MINSSNIIVWDTETGGINPETCELLQIAAVCLHPRSLEIVPGSEFSCYVKPNDWGNVSQEALNVNKITREIVEKDGLELKTAWKSFTDYLKSYNPKGNKWTAPICAGQNIRNYDMVIFNRLCKQFNSPDNLFNARNSIDILDLCFYWFESAQEPGKYNLDTLRDFLGIERDGAHNAITDVKHCAMIISRFLKFHRKHSAVEKFKGAFAK